MLNSQIQNCIQLAFGISNLLSKDHSEQNFGFACHKNEAPFFLSGYTLIANTIKHIFWQQKTSHPSQTSPCYLHLILSVQTQQHQNPTWTKPSLAFGPSIHHHKPCHTKSNIQQQTKLHFLSLTSSAANLTSITKPISLTHSNSLTWHFDQITKSVQGPRRSLALLCLKRTAFMFCFLAFQENSSKTPKSKTLLGLKHHPNCIVSHCNHFFSTYRGLAALFLQSILPWPSKIEASTSQTTFTIHHQEGSRTVISLQNHQKASATQLLFQIGEFSTSTFFKIDTCFE